MPVHNDWSVMCQQVHDWLQGWHWKSESCQQVGPASKFEADQFNRVAFAWEMLIFMSVSQEVARAIFVGLQDALLSQQALWLHINRLDDHVRACLQEQSTALDLACCLRDRFESKRSYEYTRFWYWHVNFSIIFLHLLKKKRWRINRFFSIRNAIRNMYQTIFNGHGAQKNRGGWISTPRRLRRPSQRLRPNPRQLRQQLGTWWKLLSNPWEIWMDGCKEIESPGKLAGTYKLLNWKGKFLENLHFWGSMFIFLRV